MKTWEVHVRLEDKDKTDWVYTVSADYFILNEDKRTITFFNNLLPTTDFNELFTSADKQKLKEKLKTQIWRGEDRVAFFTNVEAIILTDKESGLISKSLLGHTST